MTKNKKAGRPPLPKSKRKKTVRLGIEQAYYDNITHAAKAVGMTEQNYILGAAMKAVKK